MDSAGEDGGEAMDYRGWELWRTADGVFCAFRRYHPGDPKVPMGTRLIRAPSADARDRLIRAWENAHPPAET